MKHARIANNTAVDVRTESPEGFFTPEIAAQFVEVPDEVENGWLLESGIWSAPPAPPEPQPEPLQIDAPRVSPVEFKLLFTAQERVAIKAARATDPVIDDFFDIVEDPRLTHVNLGLQSTQDALAYLEATGLITTARRQEILAGQVQ